MLSIHKVYRQTNKTFMWNKKQYNLSPYYWESVKLPQIDRHYKEHEIYVQSFTCHKNINS